MEIGRITGQMYACHSDETTLIILEEDISDRSNFEMEVDSAKFIDCQFCHVNSMLVYP